MEGIKTIATRTKTGKCKIDLPIENDTAKIHVMVIAEAVKRETEKDHRRFCGYNDKQYRLDCISKGNQK